jgi:hypothetical protein
MIAFMAGPMVDAGQQVAYLQFFLIPCLLKLLCQATYPTDRLRKTTYNVFVWENPGVGCWGGDKIIPSQIAYAERRNQA